MNARWLFGLALGFGCLSASANDWPQWRGPNRDNKITGFTPPKVWPKTLKQQWKVTVGIGTASPALVGDMLYLFARQGGDEVTLCLDAKTGQEVWKDKYAAKAVGGAAGSHPGPRSTPTVADGKVVTLGVGGVLSCLDAASGKIVWRKETKSWPRFYTSSSPIIVDGNCIAHIGSDGSGSVTAYDLAKGDEKWKWTGDGPGYDSPVLMTAGGTRQLVALTDKNLVGIGVADGKLLWQTPFRAKYNTVTPIIDGETVIYAGQGNGTVSLKIEKDGDTFATKEVWKQAKGPHQYNTPVLREGLIYGLNPNRNLYCQSAKTGDILWTDTARRGDCGAILDAGSVLLALSTDSELIAFKPSEKGYVEVAKIKVADTPVWTIPVVVGNRVFVKDKESLILWTFE